MSDLLELRDAMNAKRPKFRVTGVNRRKRVSQDSWRKPRGIHNKEKKGKFGKRSVAGIGYRGPLAVRGLIGSGKIPALVHTLADVSKVDPKVNCVIIAKTGTRVRQIILAECKTKGVEVLNWDVDGALNKIKESLEKRKALKTVKKEKKPETKKIEKKTQEVSDEDKKESERKEMEKVLTRRE